LKEGKCEVQGIKKETSRGGINREKGIEKNGIE